MSRFSFASTKQKDQFYEVRMDIADDFFFLETEGGKFVFLDSRELEVFREANRNPKIKILPLEPIIEKVSRIEDKADLYQKSAFQILKDFDIGKAKVPSYFPLDMADYLRLKGFDLVVKKPFCSGREIKSQWEAEEVERNIKKVHRAFERVEEIIENSKAENGRLILGNETLTSEFLKREVRKILSEEDMVSAEGMIVSSGRQSSVPHHPGWGEIRGEQTIVCDLFPCSLETGYFADMTRTYVKGEPSPELKGMFEAVLESQEAAFEAIKPGVRIKDVYQKASKVFLEKGFDVGKRRGFTHSLGHGIGLDVHESPSISGNSEDILKPGHLFTVEPGLYYPELGGVRIEDVVLVTENGFKNLTNYPKNFVIS